MERLGLDFQIATRLTSWVAVDTGAAVEPGAPVRTVRVPQELPHGLSADALGLRAPASPPSPPGGGPRVLRVPLLPPPRRRGRRAFRPRGDFDEKTRVTQVVQQVLPGGTGPKTTDCLVVIYTKEPTLLGKRFVLENNLTRVGRGEDNHIVLDGDLSRAATPTSSGAAPPGAWSTTGAPTAPTFATTSRSPARRC